MLGVAVTRLQPSLRNLLAPALVVACLCGPGHAAELSASAFFKPFLSQIALSPDGSHFAAVIARAEKETIIVRSIGEGAPVPIVRNEESWRVSRLVWANDERLIFERELFGGGVQRRQVWAVNRDGSNRKGLGDFIDQPDAGLVDVLRSKPDRVLVSHEGKVLELDIVHGHRGKPLAEISALRRWYADQSGAVRAGASASDAPLRRLLLARADAAASLGLVSDFDPFTEPGLEFGAFSATPGKLIVATSDPVARRRLHEYDLASAQLGTQLFAHPEVDVGAVVLDHSGRAVGVDYVVDLPQRYYWDEGAAAEQRGLDLALSAPTNRIASSSWDGRTKLISSSGPSRAPIYYLLQRDTGELAPLFSIYPELDAVTLAEVRAISFAARDGLTLHGYVTTPSRGTPPFPTIVLVHDHSAAQPGRDWLRFDPLVQFLAYRGFAVLQVNYRGSGGYGGAFVAAGRNEWGLGMQSDLEDGVIHLISKGIADPKRVGLFGHGFGGFMALMAVVRNPDFFGAAACYGAPTDLATLLREGKNDWGELVAEGDDAVGAWADRRRVSAASPYDHLGQITVPILIGHGGRDVRVDIKHGVRLQRELEILGRKSAFHPLRDEHAEITRDDNRAIFYSALADFFAAELEAKEPGESMQEK